MWPSRPSQVCGGLGAPSQAGAPGHRPAWASHGGQRAASLPQGPPLAAGPRRGLRRSPDPQLLAPAPRPSQGDGAHWAVQAEPRAVEPVLAQDAPFPRAAPGGHRHPSPGLSWAPLARPSLSLSPRTGCPTHPQWPSEPPSVPGTPPLDPLASVPGGGPSLQRGCLPLPLPSPGPPAWFTPLLIQLGFRAKVHSGRERSFQNTGSEPQGPSWGWGSCCDGQPSLPCPGPSSLPPLPAT